MYFEGRATGIYGSSSTRRTVRGMASLFTDPHLRSTRACLCHHWKRAALFGFEQDRSSRPPQLKSGNDRPGSFSPPSRRSLNNRNRFWPIHSATRIRNDRILAVGDPGRSATSTNSAASRAVAISGQRPFAYAAGASDGPSRVPAVGMLCRSCAGECLTSQLCRYDCREADHYKTAKGAFAKTTR